MSKDRKQSGKRKLFFEAMTLTYSEIEQASSENGYIDNSKDRKNVNLV